ncbi:MAG TPA: ATP-binding protein [Candidatus Saccharimonadales bacterium]|nr:ATP-binding protein [Candidatus Saccharimonadales bacterium]
MNNLLLEELLNEDESSALDFKRDQYPFDKASDDEKSELLKDVLAFANSWRRADAYILIGVDEVKGGRSQIVGVNSHLDDANLQQFVNGKTQRPVHFSYEAFPIEGKQIGIIHIPLQDRPIYLKRNFGKLKEREVYIRRGSSTAIADPDEIASMGSLRIREALGESSSQPKINPVMKALRQEMEQGNVVLIEIIDSRYPNRPRFQCKVIEVNDLYANFREDRSGQEHSGDISRITVSYEATMKMKMFTIDRK